ncbi:1,4-dihydroxy-2-naphthoate polyprenyltransferase [Ferroacidibacillus organovorans]|uniref:1,4-dihydroxy-2-naphthoate polyprenyltransferase n=1 Tax=Ferroacidibacillus organovorans TaxID=1765683 RepID=UPI000A60A3DE|nr:1,4-dihydroxy-2-naphthoate polyprenyltransferase [Ferroacidibacillus organovorans]
MNSFRNTLWNLLRPKTLTASVTPVLVGTGAALLHHPLHTSLFLSMLIASMLIQAAANMVNEYYDFVRGLDSKEMTGIAGAIVRDNMSPRTVLIITWVTLTIALLLGIYICASTSWWVAVFGAASMLFMYLYSGGPKPISSTPFGEVTAGVAMGPVIILIAYFIQAGHLSPVAWWVSVPVGLLIAAILLANNLRDLEHDRPGGRKTLPILLGKTRAVAVLGTAFALSYLILIALVLARMLPSWALLSLLSAPLPARVPRQFLAAKTRDELQASFENTSKTLIAFGFLLFVGLLIARITTP